jgi:hypothetical protein
MTHQLADAQLALRWLGGEFAISMMPSGHEILSGVIIRASG